MICAIGSGRKEVNFQSYVPLLQGQKLGQVILSHSQFIQNKAAHVQLGKKIMEFVYIVTQCNSLTGG